MQRKRLDYLDMAKGIGILLRAVLAWPEFFDYYVYTCHLFGGILCVTGRSSK